MKTYKITVELRVDSTNESIDDIITEVGRAIYHTKFYADTIEHVDSVFTLNVEICQCAYCNNRDTAVKEKKAKRSGKNFKFLIFKPSK